MAVEPLLPDPGCMVGRVEDEKDPLDGPGPSLVGAFAVPGDPLGNSGKGLISVSGIAACQNDKHMQQVDSRGPEVGSRPSRSAFAPSAAFHRAY